MRETRSSGTVGGLGRKAQPYPDRARESLGKGEVEMT
jgi:hypothetical protein